jgi:regulator of replication initiation timing
LEKIADGLEARAASKSPSQGEAAALQLELLKNEALRLENDKLRVEADHARMATERKKRERENARWSNMLETMAFGGQE